MNKIKILLVDDSAFMRKIIKEFLDIDTFDIVECSNGADAVELYKKLNPSIVSMDITMPIMDGNQALIKIKEFDNDALVMMSTAIGQKAFVEESIKNGATNYIVKPFTKEVFLGKVDELIQKGLSLQKCPYQTNDCNNCNYVDNCRIIR